MPAEA